MSTEDEIRNIFGAADETEVERVARVKNFQAELRPYANELRDRYATYLSQFGMDDAKAFQAMIMYVQVSVELGRFDQDALLALVVFMARRLSYHEPRLAATLN